MTKMGLQSQLLQSIPGFQHLFTTRNGGVSRGDFSSLNLKYPVTPQDDTGQEAAVRENRQRVCDFLGLALEQMVTSQQIHADHIHEVTRKDAGRGAFSHADGLSACDGLMTQEKGLALLVMVADCYPVMLVDPQQRAAAVLHSGWRGTQKQITSKGILQMQHRYGSRPGDLYVAIGPGIGFDRFEVGPEVLEAFQEQISADDPELVFHQGDGKVRLNLPEIIRRQALQAQVPEAQIELVGGCTHSEAERFFSYRRDGGRTGRLGGWLGWST